MKRPIFLLLILFSVGIWLCGKMQAQPAVDSSATISLLTSSPWEKETYALFGHSAIRLQDSTKKLDLVFNYGMFDFNRPHFIYHFVRGETDYYLGATDYLDYEIEYRMRGLEVTEQTLNLNKEEKNAIWYALIENYAPEYRQYRYNFFFDNCATRPLNIIANNLYGRLDIPEPDTAYTYRQFVEQCTKNFPWLTYGINLVLGSEADVVAGIPQMMFLPANLMKGFEKAEIISPQGNKRPLVAKQETIIEGEQKTHAAPSFITPGFVALLSLAITLALALTAKRRNTLFKIWQALLFFAAGVGGILLYFLSFFSEHPCIFPNWNILWLQPLQLIVPLLSLVKTPSKVLYIYHFINFAALLIFMAASPFIGQTIPPASILFALSMTICSVRYIYNVKKNIG